MSENVNFYQGSKENYDPSEMQGGLYFSKDNKEILLNGATITIPEECILKFRGEQYRMGTY